MKDFYYLHPMLCHDVGIKMMAVHLDRLAPYQEPLGMSGLKEGVVGAVGE
jgi:hypothetical protein